MGRWKIAGMEGKRRRKLRKGKHCCWPLRRERSQERNWSKTTESSRNLLDPRQLSAILALPCLILPCLAVSCLPCLALPLFALRSPSNFAVFYLQLPCLISPCLAFSYPSSLCLTRMSFSITLSRLILPCLALFHLDLPCLPLLAFTCLGYPALLLRLAFPYLTLPYLALPCHGFLLPALLTTHFLLLCPLTFLCLSLPCFASP